MVIAAFIDAQTDSHPNDMTTGVELYSKENWLAE